jgi:hypothetical protein
VVTERCTGLQIPHKYAVSYSPERSLLQGIAPGLGSDQGQIVSVGRGLRIAGPFELDR